MDLSALGEVLAPQDPTKSEAMLRAGLAMMQPVRFGQTALGNLAGGIGEGFNSYHALQAEERRKQMEAAELTRRVLEQTLLQNQELRAQKAEKREDVSFPMQQAMREEQIKQAQAETPYAGQIAKAKAELTAGEAEYKRAFSEYLRGGKDQTTAETEEKEVTGLLPTVMEQMRTPEGKAILAAQLKMPIEVLSSTPPSLIARKLFAISRSPTLPRDTEQLTAKNRLDIARQDMLDVDRLVDGKRAIFEASQEGIQAGVQDLKDKAGAAGRTAEREAKWKADAVKEVAEQREKALRTGGIGSTQRPSDYDHLRKQAFEAMADPKNPKTIEQVREIFRNKLGKDPADYGF